MRRLVMLAVSALLLLGVAGVAAAEPGGIVILRAQERGPIVVLR